MPLGKDSSVCHLGCCKSVNSIWDKVELVQNVSDKNVAAICCFLAPLCPWFPSFPLLQVGIFHDNGCESILPKPHLQKRHGVMIGQISKYAVHTTVSSGIRTEDVLRWGDQCGVSHNFLMSWEERQMGGQHCKEPQNSSRRAVNQHRGSPGDLSGEMAWNFTEYWWARSRQGKQHIWREANNVQLSQMFFIIPQTWGYFLHGVMNLIASLLPHLFTDWKATPW